MATQPHANNTFVTQASKTSAEIEEAIARRKAGKQEEKKGGHQDVDITEHQMTDEEVFQKFGIELNKGLTSAQVSENQEKFGKNKLTPAKTKHPLVLLLEQMTGFFSLLLWLASALCFLAYGLNPDIPDNLYLGIVLAVVTFLTGIFSFYQEYNANAIMEGFKDFLPKKCEVIRDGKTYNIEAEDVVPGDVVCVKAGDAIPADLRIMQATDFKVDNASLTGESDAQTRTNKNTEENPMEATNLAFFGTNCAKGKAQGIVIKIGDDTLIGTIAALTATTDDKKTPIAIEIEHFIHIVSGVAVFLGVTFFIIGASMYDPLTNLVFMIGIIVANVPEGLLATVTVSLTLTAKRMAEKNVLVKNLEAVETLGSTTVIASDKTGTLTQNRMTAVELFIFTNNENGQVNKKSTYPLSTVQERDQVQNHGDVFVKALMSMALCNNAKFEASEENMSRAIQQRETQGDASESALLKFCEHIVKSTEEVKDVIAFREKHPKIGEIPFNSTNKYQVSVHLPNGDENVNRLLVMKGAPERIWGKCCKVNVSGEVVDKTAEHKEIFDANIGDMMFKGERVLGLCYAELDSDEYDCPPKEGGVYQESPTYDPSLDDIFGKKPYDPNAEPHREAEKGDIQLVFCGLIALIDPPRPTVPKAVLSCQKAGIKVIMVTGDHPETAESIARKVYIIRDKTQRDVMRQYNLKEVDDKDARVQAIVIPGKKLATLTEEELDDFLDYDQIVFARTSPAQKLKIVEGLQRKTHVRRNLDKPKPVKHVVAVTGDGVNDSPALKAADIGVAMGITGTNVAKDAADMILLDDNFASIVQGVEEGRLIFDNLKKSIAYTLSSNIPEISPFLIFILLQVPLPLPTILILCIDLGTDMVPAISLAYEGREANIMSKPPRDARTDRLVTAKLVCFSYLQVGIVQAAAGFYAWVVVLKDFGFDPKDLPQAGWAFDRATFGCLVQVKDGELPSAFTTDKKFDPSEFSCGRWGANTLGDCIGSGGADLTPANNSLGSNWLGGPSTILRRYGFSSRETNCWTENGQFQDKTGYQLWARHLTDDSHKNWEYVLTTTECWVNPGGGKESVCWNPAEALMYAQTAYFISIIIVQWADILACKTRTLSLKNQGMRNNMLSFGLFFETALGAILCYVPFVNLALATRPIYFVHWLAPMPFAIFILSYDEIRKWLMRNLSADFQWTQRATWMKRADEGDQPKNWVWRNTYY